MNKYRYLFNGQTLAVAILSLISSMACLHFQWGLYIDFLVLGLLVVFPITVTIKESFKRREQAMKYLSTLKASLESMNYSFEINKSDWGKKSEAREMLWKISDQVLHSLKRKEMAVGAIKPATDALVIFLLNSRGDFKSSFASKIIGMLFRVNESIEGILSVKHHRTPAGLRTIVLIAIYAFVLFYPASLLAKQGFEQPLWYVYAMTVFKSVLLIALFNVQTMLDDPFSTVGPDAIRLDDFKFSPLVVTETETTPVSSNFNDDDDDE